jgi:hypothetical protein
MKRHEKKLAKTLDGAGFVTYFGLHTTQPVSCSLIDTMNTQTKSDNKCRTISWPVIMDEAIERTAREKGCSVSMVLRQWVVPMLRERDERFNREWTLRSTRIRFDE